MKVMEQLISRAEKFERDHFRNYDRFFIKKWTLFRNQILSIDINCSKPEPTGRSRWMLEIRISRLNLL